MSCGNEHCLSPPTKGRENAPITYYLFSGSSDFCTKKDDKEEVCVPEEENTYTYANMIKHYKTCDIGEVFYKCPKCHDPK